MQFLGGVNVKDQNRSLARLSALKYSKSSLSLEIKQFCRITNQICETEMCRHSPWKKVRRTAHSTINPLYNLRIYWWSLMFIYYEVCKEVWVWKLMTHRTRKRQLWGNSLGAFLLGGNLSFWEKVEILSLMVRLFKSFTLKLPTSNRIPIRNLPFWRFLWWVSHNCALSHLFIQIQRVSLTINSVEWAEFFLLWNLVFPFIDREPV